MHGPTCIFWANLTPLSLQPNFDAIAPVVQRVRRRSLPRISCGPCVQRLGSEASVLRSGQDIAEAIAQLAVYRPGREALLEEPSVLEALRQVCRGAWARVTIDQHRYVAPQTRCWHSGFTLIF